MDEVAHLAELSKGALYLYFPSKDALLAAVAERSMAAHLPRLRSAVRRARSGLDQVLVVVRYHATRFREEPEVFRMMIEWLLEPNLDDRSDDFAAYRTRVDETFGLLLEALDRGRRDGSIRADVDPLHQAMQIWSSSLGVLLMHHNASAVGRRILHPIDFTHLPALHEQTLRRALAPEGDAS
jgi:AcrR family transcriptional regulator